MSDLLNSGDWQTYMAFAHRLADAASPITMAHFRTVMDVTDKGEGEFDPVTVADQQAETAMRGLITEHYPSHGILGEEYSETTGSSRYQWVLDPIDGTRAYISGLPTWGTLIALLEDGEPILGIIDQPFTKERYSGWTNGALLNGEPIKSRTCKKLSDATLSTTGTNWFTDSEREAFDRLKAACKLTRYGYDCYAYAMVAHGFMDIVAEAGLKTVDIMALIPIIRGAGGAVAGWKGDDVTDSGRLLAVGDADLTGLAQEALGL